MRRSAAGLAVVVSICGCRADDAGPSQRPFVTQANAVCARANADVRALGPEPPILIARQAEWIEALTAIDRTALRRLGALRPPEDERRAIAAMLAAYDRGLARGAAIARASRAGDGAALRRNVDAALEQFARAQTVAAEHGLGECALLGQVSR